MDFGRYFEEYLQLKWGKSEPENLYQPFYYSLGNAGKLFRPQLLLTACDLFDGSANNAMPAAAAIEMFHNFTLLHDDIMDNAPLRRGKASVYAHFGTNTAILSGDAMMFHAIETFMLSKGGKTSEAFSLFVQTGIEICEGQQLDMDFEQRETVTEAEYMEMIRLKTAVLLGASVKIGALLADASSGDAHKLYEFGIHLGLGFQLTDDYLDTFGDEAKTGKKSGGDILNGKKTLLLIKALERASAEQREWLLKSVPLGGEEKATQEKIRLTKEIMTATGAKDYCHSKIEYHRQQAVQLMASIQANNEKKKALMELGEKAVSRDK